MHKGITAIFTVELYTGAGYYIRNTTLNEWNLHETSVIPTSGTEIRYLNLTRPQAE